MNWSNIATQINWKTTGFALGYLACKLFGWAVPAAASLCEVAETFVVAGGFVSAADSTRLKTIVQAVDHLLWKSQIDPETLAPVVVK